MCTLLGTNISLPKTILGQRFSSDPQMGYVTLSFRAVSGPKTKPKTPPAEPKKGKEKQQQKKTNKEDNKNISISNC